MEGPRNPLITGVTNNPLYANDDKVPSSYALANVMAGAELDADANVDTLVACGTYRYTATSTGIPSHLLGTTGIITVLMNRGDLPSNDYFGADQVIVDGTTVLRQIVWPDGPSDIIPYTRTASKSGTTWTFTDWQTMGGNLKRVVLTASITAAANTMYQSFSNYTLTLPTATDCPLATRIGIEQYSGAGIVTCGSQSIDVLPVYITDESGNATTTVAGPNVYMFEVVATSNDSKEWILQIDNTKDSNRELDSHANNADIHVTKAQKDSWNNHINNNDVHVTAAQKNTWVDNDFNYNLRISAASKLATIRGRRAVIIPNLNLGWNLDTVVNYTVFIKEPFEQVAGLQSTTIVDGATTQSTFTLTTPVNGQAAIADILSAFIPIATINSSGTASLWLPLASLYPTGASLIVEAYPGSSFTMNIATTGTNDSNTGMAAVNTYGYETFSNQYNTRVLYIFEVQSVHAVDAPGEACTFEWGLKCI